MSGLTDAKSDPRQSEPQLAPRIHKMLGHPLRYAVITKLGERPWTSRELADVLHEDIKRVSEAIETLGKEGLVEVVSEEAGPKGGRVPVYGYRSARFVFDAEEWARLPAVERENASVMISRLLTSEIGQALNSGLFDSHRHRVLIRRPVFIDDQGAAEIDKILLQTDRRIAAAEARSTRRLADTGEKPHRFLTGLISAPAKAVESRPENSG